MKKREGKAVRDIKVNIKDVKNEIAKSIGLVLLVAGFTIGLSGCTGTDYNTRAGDHGDASYDNAQNVHQRTLAYYRAQYKADPSDFSALIGYARNLRYSGMAGKALKILAKAPVSYQTQPVFLTEQGKAYLATGDVAAAQTSLEAALAQDEESWDAWSALGISYDLQKDHEKAVPSYRKAAAICPRSPSLHNNLGLSTALSGELSEAKTFLTQAAVLQPHSQRIRNNLALVSRIERRCPRCSKAEIRRRLSPVIASPDWAGGDLACSAGRDDIIDGLTHGSFVDMAVEFAFDSAALTPQAMAQLDNLGAALLAPSLADKKIRLEGHTDATGPAAYNQTLSERRARAVKNYLVRIAGISPARLETVGYGESRLLDAAHPYSGVNRRVRISRQDK